MRRTIIEGEWRKIVRRVLAHQAKLGFLVALVAAAVLVSGAAKPVDDAPWFHGIGTQHFDYGGTYGELDRVVEAWVAADGRYKVVVTSPDGAAEEFTYDGVGVLMFVTPPGQKEPLSVMKLKSPRIFAVDGFPALADYASDKEFPANRRWDKVSGLPTFVHRVGIDGASYRLSMSWQAIETNPSLMEPSRSATKLLSGYVFNSNEPDPGEGPSTRFTSSNSTTFYDNLYSHGPCVFAKNFRNAEHSYLRAYSSARGDCVEVAVTGWHRSQIAQSLCQVIGFRFHSMSASGYANGSTYTATQTPTCTSHAGWWDGLMVVPYLGLSTNPYND